MVDFNKRVTKEKLTAKTDPREIYESLDRATDKGPLRPAQASVLGDWYTSFRDAKDVIIKLPTGEGKTLIGLLALQSRLNQKMAPVVYLCPNNHLVDQTCQQADTFGIKYVKAQNDLSDEFLSGRSILITSVSKLFNGETRFGLKNKSLSVDTVLLDDSHACINIIKDSCKITLDSNTSAYSDLLKLFGPELEKQGLGTYTDILDGDFNSFLPVPYWDWQDKASEVAEILVKNKSLKEIHFTWSIIKDILKDCQCVISGKCLEIVPHITPLSMFGSYYKAKQRIFMSATMLDDSFFINGLGVAPEAILNPLCAKSSKWSGEKMIVFPSLIDSSLDRQKVVYELGGPLPERKIGLVVLSPSFSACRDWEAYGATIATKDTIKDEIEKLKARKCENTLVIVNRYDGVDLPDHLCRVLIFDSMPYADSLIERYQESCRGNSDALDIKKAQVIEQGLGRAVRGEKDYCAVLIIGPDLIKFIQSSATKHYFSNQTRAQIDIGFDVAEYAKEDIEKGKTPYKALFGLVNQLLARDTGWKEFYSERMSKIPSETPKKRMLEIFKAENNVDRAYSRGDAREAVSLIQKILDNYISGDVEKGWYLQEMARLAYSYSKNESNTFQVAAHKANPYLLKPRNGVMEKNISKISLNRVANIIKKIQKHENYEDLKVNLDCILNNLRFGVSADKFEKAFNDLGDLLGFYCMRPDKELKEGPDNLWKIGKGEYLIVECKNVVNEKREEITKKEAGQMNTACVWFETKYSEPTTKGIMIVPTRKLSRAAALNPKVEIMCELKLKKMRSNVEAFFMEFKSCDFKDINQSHVQKLIDAHGLTSEDILTKYSDPPIK